MSQLYQDALRAFGVYINYGFTLDAALAPGMLQNPTIQFIGTDGGGTLVADSHPLISCRDHRFWRAILPYLQKGLSPEIFQQVRQAIHDANKLEYYEPLPKLK